jgi:hypothetical protein
MDIIFLLKMYLLRMHLLKMQLLRMDLLRLFLLRMDLVRIGTTWFFRMILAPPLHLFALSLTPGTYFLPSFFCNWAHLATLAVAVVHVVWQSLYSVVVSLS